MCFICAQRNPFDAFAGSIVHSAQRTPSAITDDPIWAGLGLVSETSDAAESTATTYRLLVGQSAMGTLSSSTDEDWFAIDLVAGQSYDFRMLGMGAGFLTDPLVRLMDATGAQILQADDGFAPELTTHQIDTAFSYTASYTGTYFLQADAYTTQTGRYLLSVTPDVPGDRPELTVDEIAWQLINNGVAFFYETEAVAFDVGIDNRISVNISALTAEGKTLAKAALDVWSAYLGFDFVYVRSGAEITFDDDEAGAFATGDISGGFITSAQVNVNVHWLQDGTSTASYAF
jgi:serralysin